jgi:hypothetical protein
MQVLPAGAIFQLTFTLSYCNQGIPRVYADVYSLCLTKVEVKRPDIPLYFWFDTTTAPLTAPFFIHLLWRKGVATQGMDELIGQLA